MDNEGSVTSGLPRLTGACLLAWEKGQGSVSASTTWSGITRSMGRYGSDVTTDTGSIASPRRETEVRMDGSDAVADWPILNALLNAVSGATWVSVHHGGGGGIGYSIYAGMCLVADGIELAERKILNVLTTDPGIGVVRHADAGYEQAKKTARENILKMPMLD